MKRKANLRWCVVAGLLTTALAVAAIPYFRWAIFVVNEPISNPLWPDRQAMFWDGIGFGLLFLILKAWWVTLPLAAALIVAWVKAFHGTEGKGTNPLPGTDHEGNPAGIDRCW